MAAATTSSPKISPQAAERLVAGDDQAGALVAAADEHEHQVGGLGVERDVADFVDDQQRDPLQPGELVVEAALALGVGEQRDPFGGGAERDAVAGQAGADADRDREMALAGAGRAEQDDVLAAGEEVELAEVQDRVAADRGLKAKSNSSSVLRAGKRAALMRPWPPWLSRLSTSVFSSAAANCSKLHSSARARSASLGSALAAAGAFSARNRCASSDAGRVMRSARHRRPANGPRRPARAGRGAPRAAS